MIEPKPKILLWPKARTDVIDIRGYIAQDNPEAAEAFHAAFENTCATLLDLPEIGSVRNFGDPELKGLRMFRVSKFEKYLIFYRNTEEGVGVVRVLHSARDIPTLFGEVETKSGGEQKAA
jgi:toxin ParE1/3/4